MAPRLKKVATPPTGRETATSEAREAFDVGDLKLYFQILRVQEKAGTLVSRELAEVVIADRVSRFCKTIEAIKRQVVNLAGAGRSRAQKKDLDLAITKIMDSAIAEFKASISLPEVGAATLGTETHQKRQVDKAIKSSRR